MTSFVIKNVRLFDGVQYHKGEYDVSFKDGLIESYQTSFISNIPSEASVIDGKDCTLLPGLIDAHTHVFRDLEELEGCMPAGVTTVLDMNNATEDAIFMKDQANERIDLPNIFSAYYAASIDGGWPIPIIKHLSNDDPKALEKLDKYPKLTTATSAEDFVATQKAQGVDFIKLMQESGECITLSSLPAPTMELQKAVIDSAHRHNLVAVAHAINLRETLLVLEAGVDGLAHQFIDKPHTPALIDAYKKRNSFVIPTFTAMTSLLGLKIAENWAKKSKMSSTLSQSSRQCLCSSMKLARPECNVKYAYDSVRALHIAGIDIVCGTDSGATIHGTALGAAVHLELELYVSECGLSPVEALRSATEAPARRFRLGDRGIIAPGKVADLLLVRGDPCSNIQDTVNVEKVWKKGRLSYTRADN